MAEMVYQAKTSLCNCEQTTTGRSGRVLEDNRSQNSVTYQQTAQLSEDGQSDMEQALHDSSETDEEIEAVSDLEEEESEEDEGGEVEIEGVLVYLDDPEDQEEIRKVRRLVIRVWREYHVDFNSDKSLAGIGDAIDDNVDEFTPKEIAQFRDNLQNELAADSWTVEELEAVEAGLSRFANLLGDRRLRRKDGKQRLPQEITSFGKLNRDMQLGDTMAETFPGQHNIAVYEDALDEHGRPPDKTELTKTIIHELTHGIIAHRTDDFKAAVPFWRFVHQQEALDESDPSHERADFTGELPPTSVGFGNAEEDFAETVAMYLFDDRSRKRLQTKYPTRYAIVHRILTQELALEAPKIPKSKSKKKNKSKAVRRDQRSAMQFGLQDY